MILSKSDGSVPSGHIQDNLIFLMIPTISIVEPKPIWKRKLIKSIVLNFKLPGREIAGKMGQGPGKLCVSNFTLRVLVREERSFRSLGGLLK